MTVWGQGHVFTKHRPHIGVAKLYRGTDTYDITIDADKKIEVIRSSPFGSSQVNRSDDFTLYMLLDFYVENVAENKVISLAEYLNHTYTR